MILITGGAFQGKLDCAKMLVSENGTAAEKMIICDGRVQGADTAASAQIWDHVTDYMRLRMEAGASPEEVEEEILQVLRVNPDIVLITRELGCGIVPVDAFDRRYREAHGRMCCRLAERATRVLRVSCGLGQVIKGGK